MKKYHEMRVAASMFIMKNKFKTKNSAYLKANVTGAAWTFASYTLARRNGSGAKHPVVGAGFLV